MELFDNFEWNQVESAKQRLEQLGLTQESVATNIYTTMLYLVATNIGIENKVREHEEKWEDYKWAEESKRMYKQEQKERWD